MNRLHPKVQLRLAQRPSIQEERDREGKSESERERERERERELAVLVARWQLRNDQMV
jgi:hypothetical protein